MLSKIAAFTAAACCSAVALAQAYPSKPIRLVVSFAPGGSSSMVARAFSAEMSKGLGQQFVVENKPGAGGNIADSAEAVGSTPKEFADFIAKEQARWKEVVQKAHVKIE